MGGPHVIREQFVVPVIVWGWVKVFAAAVWAKALAENPPNRLAFRFGTSVIELTSSGGVPVATVEMSWFDVISPLLVMFNPVSAKAEVPSANSRLSVPEGEGVLLPTGSVCQRKV